MYIDPNLYVTKVTVPKNGIVQFNIKDGKIEIIQIVDLDKQDRLEKEKIERKLQELKTKINSKCFNCYHLGVVCGGSPLDIKDECKDFQYVEELDEYQIDHL